MFSYSSEPPTYPLFDELELLLIPVDQVVSTILREGIDVDALTIQDLGLQSLITETIVMKVALLG